MRVLVFLVVSSTAHFLAARWLLAVFPAARLRRALVVRIAAVLAIALAALRLISWFVRSSALDTAMAVATTELAAVAMSLPPLLLLALSLRVGARVVDLVKPPETEAAEQERVGRREAIERVAGVGIFGATSVALGWGVVRGRHDFVIEEVVVKVPGWPRALDGYVIAQVSDIHVGPFVGDRELDEGFEYVKRVRPDLVVATGDLVDHAAGEADRLAAKLSKLVARDGVHVILGNHDHYAGAAEVVARLRDGNVNVLVNEGVRLRAGDGGGFALLGVDDLKGRAGRSPGFEGPDLRRAIAGLHPDLPRILLAHQPPYFLESAGRVALQLSGHTHGGQINPGWRPAGAVMDFIAGRYERDGSTLWVNRGFGVVGPPARLGAPPEVTKIVIVSA